MPITVAPTLADMADVYRRSLVGGPRSDRFRAYVELGARGAPVHGYNPMTSKPVLATVEALLAVDAETRLERIADATLRSLGERLDDVMFLTVATPGMWTDRLATEVEHRLLAKDPASVTWWFDDPVDVSVLDAEVVGQTVRLIRQRREGAPSTLASAVRQEGMAGALAGRPGRLDPVAAEALDVLGDDPSLGTMVAFLYGDRAARAMGFTPIGLDDAVGAHHAVALAAATLAT